MLNRNSACTIVLVSVSLSCAAHAGNIFSDAIAILQDVNAIGTIGSSETTPEVSVESQERVSSPNSNKASQSATLKGVDTIGNSETTPEVSVESQERVGSPNSNKASQSATREISLSPYQKQVAKEFKDNLRWMYDENMTYTQLPYGSPEKKTIDFVADKVASSVAQCNGRYFTQMIQGSSLVASTVKAGNIYEITDPSYKGHTRNRQLTKAERLNGEEYSGAVFLEINNTAIKATDSSKWQNGSSLSRNYTIDIVNGSFIDATPFSEGHLQNLKQYQPLQCSDIKL